MQTSMHRSFGTKWSFEVRDEASDRRGVGWRFPAVQSSLDGVVEFMSGGGGACPAKSWYKSSIRP